MRNRISRLKNSSVRKVEINNNVIKEILSEDKGFPLVTTPEKSDLSLNNWLHNNKKEFDSDLYKHGGILLRNFKVNTVEKFEEFIDSFPNKLLEYKLRSSPRHSLANNIYVSTTYPSDQSIEMHSESSYTLHPPENIIFCCIKSADEQGETPIADNRKVLSFLSEKTKNKFKEKGVQYRRNLSGVLGLPWQEVFQTTDKKVVEEECKKNKIDFNWVDSNNLTLTWNKKAIWNHPVTQEEVWFNHALFFNKYSLDPAVLESVKSENEIPNNTFFGDGTRITQEEVEEIQEAYKKSTVLFPWEEGDVLFLDNMLMSHGRSPYKGERKIIVSMF